MTDTLRAGISALIETYEDTSAVPNDRLRALLAAAPAPTEAGKTTCVHCGRSS